jgi:polar amino acid transport system substrate-binding protein
MGSKLWVSPINRRDFLRGGAALGLGGTALFLAACGGASSPIGAETDWQRIKRTKVVTFGYSNEPPFSIKNPDGTVTGEAPEVLQAVMTPYNVKLQPVLTEFSSLIPGLLANRFDVIAAGTAITPARCAQIAFGNPDTQIVDTFLVKKGNPKNLHSYADIAANPHAILGTGAGTAYVGYATAAKIPQSRVLLFQEIALAPQAVLTGRVDAYALPALTAKQQLLKLTNPNLELADPYNPPPGVAPFYVALGFRKADTDFVDAYNAGLAQLISGGQLKQIMQPLGFDVVTPGVTAADLCKS